MQGKFSDIPYFLITTYFSTLAYIDRFANEPHSMLIGPRTSIVTKGAPVQEVFVKDETIGYRAVWITPASTEGNEFNAIKSNRATSPSETYTEISGDSYYFRVYDILREEDFIEDGDEIYFRKDSPFYEWLLNNAESIVEDKFKKEFIIRNFINTDNDFIFFGKIYSKSYQENLFMIDYYNVKDFIVDMIPTHQQTVNFKEFMMLYGDMIFNEAYALQKNIFSLIDPFTIDEKYLNHLSSICGISIDDLDLGLSNKRALVHELINILKAKGTFVALKYLWKLVTKNTKNIINFYEIWHDKTIAGLVPLVERKELPWQGYYGIQPEELEKYYSLWIDRYYNIDYPQDMNELTLATQYKVEIDLTKEPIHTFDIFNQTLADKIYDYWEIFRPINRVADYNIFISPITDLTTRKIPLYEGNPQAQVYSRSYVQNVTSQNSSIRIFRLSAAADYEYIIEHNLNSRHVLIQLYSFDLKMLIPDYVEYIDNNRVKIRLKTTKTIFALLRRPSFTSSRPWGYSETNLTTKYYVSDFLQDSYHIVPEEFEIIDLYNNQITPLEESINGMYTGYSFLTSREAPETTWTISHNQIGKMFISVYDLNNKKMYPDSIYLVTENQAILEFGEPTSGYAVLTNLDNGVVQYSGSDVTEWTVEHDLNADLLNVQIYDLSNTVIIPNEIEYVDKNTIKVYLEEPTTIFAAITVSDNELTPIAWNIVHNLNYREVLTQFAKDYVQLVPEQIKLSNINLVQTTVTGGTTLLSKYDYLHTQASPSSMWNVEHNFGHAGTLVNIYDENNNKLYSKNIQLMSDNELVIEFDEPTTGYAVVVSIGSIYFIEIAKLVKVRFSNTDFTEIYETTITDNWDDDEYLYFRLDIPRDVQLTINRIELITNEDKTIFETNCDSIYKSENFTMNTFYRVFKGVI